MKFEKEVQRGVVKGVYLCPNSNSKEPDYFFTTETSQLDMHLEGILMDRHHGINSLSGGRNKNIYKKGTWVRNNRQWTAITHGEIDKIAENLGVGSLRPEMLGINLLIGGIENISQLSPMTYLIISDQEDFRQCRMRDTVLVVYGQALPCKIAGKGLAEALDDPSLESKFPKAALGYRGTTGWVEKRGVIKPGDNVYVMTPKGLD